MNIVFLIIKSLKETIMNKQSLFVLLVCLLILTIFQLSKIRRVRKADPYNYIDKRIEELRSITGSSKVVRRYFFRTQKVLRASYNMKKDQIEINPLWMLQIVNQKLELALEQTMGHEKMHSYDIKYKRKYKKSRKRRQLYWWSCEVHSDIEGLNLALEIMNNQKSRSEYMVQIYEKVKINTEKGDKHSFSHPSWSKRVEWLEKYQLFDREVIYEIARELHITDEKYIEDIINEWELVLRKN